MLEMVMIPCLIPRFQSGIKDYCNWITKLEWFSHDCWKTKSKAIIIIATRKRDGVTQTKTIALIGFTSQLDLLVKSITCLFLIGRVIIIVTIFWSQWEDQLNPKPKESCDYSTFNIYLKTTLLMMHLFYRWVRGVFLLYCRRLLYIKSYI